MEDIANEPITMVQQKATILNTVTTAAGRWQTEILPILGLAHSRPSFFTWFSFPAAGPGMTNEYREWTTWMKAKRAMILTIKYQICLVNLVCVWSLNWWSAAVARKLSREVAKRFVWVNIVDNSPSIQGRDLVFFFEAVHSSLLSAERENLNTIFDNRYIFSCIGENPMLTAMSKSSIQLLLWCSMTRWEPIEPQCPVRSGQYCMKRGVKYVTDVSVLIRMAPSTCTIQWDQAQGLFNLFWLFNSWKRLGPWKGEAWNSLHLKAPCYFDILTARKCRSSGVSKTEKELYHVHQLTVWTQELVE